VYPNLGYFSNTGWRFEREVGGEEYAAMALKWREEGAQIIGGCCGVGPEHIVAAGAALADTEPGHHRPPDLLLDGGDDQRVRGVSLAPWSDQRRRSLFPLEFPD